MTTVKPGTILPLVDDHLLLSQKEEALGILGCINENDGSGYIHALLNAYHPGYSRMRNDYYRTHLAKSVRIGALADILKVRFGEKSLSTTQASESKHIFSTVMAFGVPLPEDLLHDYAEFLNVGYRLFSPELEIIEDSDDNMSDDVANIIVTSENEYHLLVLLREREYRILFHL